MQRLRCDAVLFAIAVMVGGCVLACVARAEGSEVYKPALPGVKQSVLDAQERFAFKFYRQCLTQDEDKNIFVSPLSVSNCLAMVYNGADGETKDAMAKALELEGLSLEDLNESIAGLASSLAGASGVEGSWFELDIANSLWANKDVEFRKDYMDRVTSAYSAQLTTLDFADPKTVPTINKWVGKQTREKITEIIDRINPDDILLLVNGVYFKGKWFKPFDKELTRPREFTFMDGSQAKVPMMNRKASFMYLKGDGFQAVSIPYGHGPLSMYVFLPDEKKGLFLFHAKLTAENWNKWMSQFKQLEGELTLPKFVLRYEPDLDKALKAMGMAIAFQEGKADFSKMTPHAPGEVWLDRTKHKTYVEVNEEGTEAAAVTSAMMGLGLADSKPFRMVVDHPFFVAIRDNRTGALLFMGAILDPRGQ